jgi:GcrA cell cycle regulator
VTQPQGDQHLSHPEAINMSANRATWSSERIELLKRCFHDGLSCSQIAREMGVTRNAVIGKMNRLRLSRPRPMRAAPLEQDRAARPVRTRTPRALRSKRSPLDVLSQRALLKVAFAEPPVEDIPIFNGCGCSLLELGQERCRWPISTPGTKDFCFCGNAPAKGLPYCPGHARIAYRPAGRQRSSA